MEASQIENLKTELTGLLAEYRRRLRLKIQTAKIERRLDPDIVKAYAQLHLVDDFGIAIKPAAHHELWLKLICDERIKKLLIIAPPEAAKTTWAISAYLGCRIGIYPEQNVIIGASSGPVAEKRSLSLRTMAESEDWKRTFPGVHRAQGMKWDGGEWSIAPHGNPYSGRLHPTIAAFGTGGSITGSRGDLILADDVLDFENSRTAHQRAYVEQWLHNSLLSRRKARAARVIVIGTSWHHDDIYAKARKGGGWVVCHTPLLSEQNQVHASLTYPDDWDYEMIGDHADQRIIA